MHFHIAQAHLDNTSVTYLQTLVSSTTQNTEEEAVSPYVIVEKLQLNSVKADYHSVPDGLKAIADIKSFLVELPKADLAHKDIVVNRLALEDSYFRVETTTLDPVEKAAEKAAEEVVEVIETPKEFTFPDWSVVVSE